MGIVMVRYVPVRSTQFVGTYVVDGILSACQSNANVFGFTDVKIYPCPIALKTHPVGMAIRIVVHSRMRKTPMSRRRCQPRSTGRMCGRIALNVIAGDPAVTGSVHPI